MRMKWKGAKTQRFYFRLSVACFLILSCSSYHSVFAQSTDSIARLKFIFVGDIMGHGGQIKAAEIVKEKNYDYTPCFKYISPLIQSADLAIGNLEVTLPGKPPYTGFPLFKSPDALVTALKQAGFDVLLTANNHANDAHLAGTIHTIDAIEQADLLQTGTFRNAAERALYYPLIVYKKGFKIAILNYTYDTNGISTKYPSVVNEIDETQIKKDFITARKIRPDIIITFMHWGEEYQTQQSDKQTDLAKKMLRWGADLVIGAHPHVVQPIDSYTLKRPNGDVEKTLVAYSLGNFISNQRFENTDGGIVLEVTFVKDLEFDKTQLVDAVYHPIWRYIRKEGNKYQYYTLPIKDFEGMDFDSNFLTRKGWREMNHYSKRVERLLGKIKI